MSGEASFSRTKWNPTKWNTDREGIRINELDEDSISINTEVGQFSIEVSVSGG